MVATSILPRDNKVPRIVLLVDTPIFHHHVVQHLMSFDSHHRGLIEMTHYISIVTFWGEAHVASIPPGILHQDALTSFQERINLGTCHSLASIMECFSSLVGNPVIRPIPTDEHPKTRGHTFPPSQREVSWITLSMGYPFNNIYSYNLPLLPFVEGHTMHKHPYTLCCFTKFCMLGINPICFLSTLPIIL